MTWAVQDRGYSQRRACGLVGLHAKTYRYASKRTSDVDLRATLRELASQRRRFGYRRLGLLLARQGVRINHKKLYRLYREERLNEHMFSSLAEARQIIEAWRIDYNTNRPHTSLNGLTPSEFAARPRQGQNWNRLSL